MAAKAVICQQAAQVGMAGEDNAIHVEHFTLIPIGRRIDRHDAGNGNINRQFRLHANALVLHQRQQMIDHLKAFFTLRIVDRGNIDQLRKMRGVILFEEFQKADQPCGHDCYGQLAM